MISLALARQLKEAGLIWKASSNDFFAIPDRGMDDRVFVLTDLQAQLDIFRGWPVVTFHGTSEWALDYILTTEVVWLPREDQLGELLEEAVDDVQSPLVLTRRDGRYQCTIVWQGSQVTTSSTTGADAYAEALLHVLQNTGPT